MSPLGLIVALAVAGLFAQARSDVSKGKLSVINSEVKPGNLLPQFMFMMGSVEGGSVGVKIGGGRGALKPFVPDDSCGDDIFEGALEDERSPQLPYLTQDLWGCEREQKEIDTIVLENDELKVTITPQYAGKVWGIWDKKRRRELLFANRAHQPANIGALKAWAAGGAEWNWSPGILGHSAFTETQIYTAEVETENGPMIRVYDFDRYNGTVWQVDMLITNYSFTAHPRITNPSKDDLRGYWWTCVAVDAKPSTRIFTPATHVAETSRNPIRNAPWPYFAEAIENATFKGYQNKWPTDNSYLGNHQIGDMFLRIPDTVYTPYIAHTQEDGYVLVHGHPLNGTKFYTWGDSGPGRFMQDFLAGGGKRLGDYTELQVGPAPTQMQSWPLPANSVREWTEWFKGFDGNTDVLRGENYQAALSEIDAWMKKEGDGMPKEVVKDIDHFYVEHATKDPSKILVQGQPWGYLEELRLGKRLAPGLVFTPPEKGTLAYKEAQPWIELVQDGTFSAETLSKLPLSYQTTNPWLDLITQSADQHGMTWLHALHIGIGFTERGIVTQSIEMFDTSMKLKPNPIAARCLGVLQTSYDDAWVYYEQAWSILQSSYQYDIDAYYRLTDNMVTEMSFFLQEQLWYDKMAVFLTMVPEAHRELDAFVTMQTKVLLYNQQYGDAKAILGKFCFPTYAKARDDLMNMWNTAVVGLAQEMKGGTPLTYVEQHQARVKSPVPENIGCQYASMYCTNYW